MVYFMQVTDKKTKQGQSKQSPVAPAGTHLPASLQRTVTVTGYMSMQFLTQKPQLSMTPFPNLHVNTPRTAMIGSQSNRDNGQTGKWISSHKKNTF